MRVSVVIPTYNKEAYIGRAVGSVLAQSMPDFEVIVVDDGSTDRSADVVRRIIDNRVVLLSKPNGGEGSARNAGIRAANSDLVCFLDADDAYQPWFLSEVIALAESNKNASMIATAFMIKERDGRVLNYLEHQLGGLIDDKYSLDYFGALSAGLYPVSSSSVCVRSSLFSEVGLFDEQLRIGADIDMWIRLCSAGDVLYSRRFSSTYHRDAENRSVDQEALSQKRLAFISKLVLRLNELQLDLHQAHNLEKFVARKGYEVFMDAQETPVGHEAKRLIQPFARHLPMSLRMRFAMAKLRS